MKSEYPLYLGNEPVMTANVLIVTDKFTQDDFAKVATASPKEIDRAISLAQSASRSMASLTALEKRQTLEYCLTQFRSREEELVLTLCREVGKPKRDAKAEVTRLQDTFRATINELEQSHGEVLTLDGTARGKGYRAFTKRVPIGPCSLISPFNFPLNLTAHKIAPAIAAGCSFVLKPASRTPVSALILGEILAKSGLPKGAFSILPCAREGADLFATDERLRLLSFTGSPAVGWALKAKAGKKKVVLELGGNAACLLDETCHWEDAVQRMLLGAFSNSGQSCISVQRIYIHDSLYDRVKEKLVAEAMKLKVGNPLEEDTAVGPLISESEAIRLESWISQAKSKGAKVLCGGTRSQSMVLPTLLENVPLTEPLSCEEAFGPVAVLTRYSDFEDGLKQINQGRFGLQAGIFTKDVSRAFRAWDQLEVGGVLINEIPSWRHDSMPYGGVKDSGLGREGIRYAVEDMTEIRLLAFRDV